MDSSSQEDDGKLENYTWRDNLLVALGLLVMLLVTVAIILMKANGGLK